MGVHNPKPFLHMYTLNLNVIRGILRAHSWHFARAFVAFCARIRGILRARSWHFARAFVAFCSCIRGILLAHSWSKPGTSRCAQDYGSRVGWRV